MKKIISVLFGAVLALCMCSCGTAQQAASTVPAVKTGSTADKGGI